MLLYISITGIILSLILLFHNAAKFRSTIYLGLFFLSLSVYVINDYVVLYSKSVLFVSLISTNITFIAYLIGPLLYWYIRSILTDDSGFKKSDFFHLAPMMVYLAASLPYMFSSYAYKVEIAEQIVNDPGFLETFEFTILSEIFSNAVVYLSRPFLALVYTLWAIILLVRYLRHRSFRLFSSSLSFMTKWLCLLLGFHLLMVVSHLLSVFLSFMSDSEVFFTMNLLQVFSFTGLSGLMGSLFLFPEILYGLSRFSEVVVSPVSEVDEKVEAISRDYNFESSYVLLIEQKTDRCMTEFQSFLQPELNLNRFADILQLPAHHLAYYFREIKKQSFNDYINGCRIEYAVSMLRQGKTNDLTLEAVGVLSGFTNRSTFFRAFKKVEGVSPGSFLATKGKIPSPT